MLPFIHFFGRTIAMYGLMVALGLITGIAIAVLRSRKHGFKPEDVLFASFFGGFGLFLGAKLFYILIMIPELIRHWSLFIEDPAAMMSYLFGGYIFYGGLIGAAAGFFLYCRIYHLTVLAMLDHVAPSVPIIHGFGRLGCLFAGCCYGIPYSGAGSIIFSKPSLAPDSIPLFPVQPLESGINFAAGILLLFYAKPIRKPGNVLGVYLVYYSLMRFLTEYFRGDNIRGFFLGLSTSQWVSLGLLPIGIWLILGLKIPKSKGKTS